jgi:hypothetical protein
MNRAALPTPDPQVERAPRRGRRRRDAALLVDDPSRGAFIDMVTSSEYLRANRDRLNGTEKHVILASKTLLSASFPEA